MRELYVYSTNYVERQKLKGKSENESKTGVSPAGDLKKQSVRQGKLVQFSRYKSCSTKVSRPVGMITCVSGGNK